jgi:hypothetical protein
MKSAAQRPIIDAVTLLATVGIASLFACLSEAQGADSIPNSGEFNAMCRAGAGTRERTYCESYLSGFVAGLFGAGTAQRLKVCPPRDLNAAKLAMLVNHLLQTSAEARSKSIYYAINLSLYNNYPCKPR